MKQIGIIVMILLSSLLVSAQDTNNGKSKNKQKLDQISVTEKHQADELAKLTKQLALTPEQQASILILQQNLNKAGKTAREAKKDDPERKAKRQKVKELRHSYNDDLMAVLTKKQQDKYQAILKAQEQSMQSQNANSESHAGSSSNDNGGEE